MIYREKKRSYAWAITLLLGLLLIFGGAGWYVYRWYMHGEEPPIPVAALVAADPTVDESEVSAQQIIEHTVPAAQPRYISIPSLSVSKTRVFSVGVDEANMLGSPANINDAAWYDKSATPGSGGVVLIDGHNGGISKDGVFANLGTLQRGAIIEVERGDGERFRYEVRENQSMALDEVNASGMKMMMMESAVPGKEALNLITCDGKWVPQYKQFDRRIMLQAVLIE